MNKRDNPQQLSNQTMNKNASIHISAPWTSVESVKCRKWQQNTLDLSDPRNIFLNPCFSNRPLPGMLVLHMTRLTSMAEITHRQCDVGSPPSRTTAVVQHDVPLSVSASTTLLPAPCNSHGGHVLASCVVPQPRAARWLCRAGHREHLSPHASSVGTCCAASFTTCVLATSLSLAVEIVKLNFQLCF